MTDESYLTEVQTMYGKNILTYGEGRFIGIGAKYTF